jgi:C4-type Zn-finger protein
MEGLAFDFEAERTVLEAILEKARQESIECDEPVPSSSTSKPLHSPLSGAEIKEGLEIAILVFKSGTAATAFIAAIRGLLKRFDQNAVVRVTDRASRKEILVHKSGVEDKR